VWLRTKSVIAHSRRLRAPLSISAFYNVYDNLRSVEFSTPLDFRLVRIDMRVKPFGVELWGNYELTDWWRLSAGVSTLHKDLRLLPGTRDPFGVALCRNDPAYQAQLRSSMTLLDRVELESGCVRSTICRRRGSPVISKATCASAGASLQR
jgi:iron complex outermembrane receptor protein